MERRRADKQLASARSRRTDRYQDRGLVELFQLLAETEDRLSGLREASENVGADGKRAFERLFAVLDEVRDELEARGICPYHQAALAVCCYS